MPVLAVERFLGFLQVQVLYFALQAEEKQALSPERDFALWLLDCAPISLKLFALQVPGASVLLAEARLT